MKLQFDLRAFGMHRGADDVPRNWLTHDQEHVRVPVGVEVVQRDQHGGVRVGWRVHRRHVVERSLRGVEALHLRGSNRTRMRRRPDKDR
eukprot:1031494-Rhodomonas_salina.3